MKKRTDTRAIFGNFTVSNNTWETQLNNNDLIVGPSGSGKTRGYVLPYINGIDNESMIVTDCKGMLYSTCKENLEEKGYDVFSIDLSSEEYAEFGYNPLESIRRNPVTGEYSQKDIEAVSAVICSEEANYTNDIFWPNGTQMLLTFFIAFVLEAFPKQYHNLDTVRQLIPTLVNIRSENEQANINVIRTSAQSRFYENYRTSCFPYHSPYNDIDKYKKVELRTNSAKTFNIYDLLAELKERNPNSIAVNTFNSLKSSAGAEKTMASFVFCLEERLSSLCTITNRMLYKAPKRIDFNRLGKEKVAVFLKVSDNDRSHDRMAKIIYAQALQTLMEQADYNPGNRLSVPVRFVFDDFASGAIIPDFDNIISVIRSREIYTSIIIQSISQLNDKYKSDKAATIINNCDHMVYLGGQDLGTVNFIAQRADVPFNDIFSMPVKSAYVFERGKQPTFLSLDTPSEQLSL